MNAERPASFEDSDENLFITGEAGTGKSTQLRCFRSATDKEVAVLAPTGVAAVSVGGQTIHSFFRFSPRPISTQEIKMVKDRRVYKALDTLIIDEMSTVRLVLVDVWVGLRFQRGAGGCVCEMPNYARCEKFPGPNPCLRAGELIAGRSLVISAFSLQHLALST